ncbi:MAG: hypothetical protein IT205_04655 [Fimbriimonadaceae bacterium]|nr:hypothetical protein [Fimbriimonadaceae bacterium]
MKLHWLVLFALPGMTCAQAMIDVPVGEVTFVRTAPTPPTQEPVTTQKPPIRRPSARSNISRPSKPTLRGRIGPGPAASELLPMVPDLRSLRRAQVVVDQETGQSPQPDLLAASRHSPDARQAIAAALCWISKALSGCTN